MNPPQRMPHMQDGDLQAIIERVLNHLSGNGCGGVRAPTTAVAASRHTRLRRAAVDGGGDPDRTSLTVLEYQQAVGR